MRAMTMHQLLDCLEFKHESALGEHVHEIRLAEIAERHLDQHFGANAGDTPCNFVAVDVLVHEPAEFVVYREHAMHDVVSDTTCRLVGQFVKFGVHGHGHGANPFLDRKMGDRNMNERDCLCIFLSLIFLSALWSGHRVGSVPQ